MLSSLLTLLKILLILLPHRLSNYCCRCRPVAAAQDAGAVITEIAVDEATVAHDLAAVSEAAAADKPAAAHDLAAIIEDVAAEDEIAVDYGN